jgi:hypothetical protein
MTPHPPLFTYAADGRRVPFDPRTIDIGGCLLCGWPVAVVGIFVPSNDAMITVVLRLRRHPARPNSTPCIAYGVCGSCNDRTDVFECVEHALEAAAERVAVQ